jgi:hypothetical protein
LCPRDHLLFLHSCSVRCYGLQDVLDGTSDGRSITWLGQPRLDAFFEERYAVGTQSIPLRKITRWDK